MAGLAARAEGASRAAISGVMDGWLRGSSRKYHSHMTTQIRVAAPSTKKETRQDDTAIRPTTIRDVAALPTREKVWVMPWAKPTVRVVSRRT